MNAYRTGIWSARAGLSQNPPYQTQTEAQQYQAGWLAGALEISELERCASSARSSGITEFARARIH